MSDLYEHFIEQLLPLAVSGEQHQDRESISLEIKLQKAQQLEGLLKQFDQLKAKLRNEKQFNRRVELNKQLQDLQLQINRIHEWLT